MKNLILSALPVSAILLCSFLVSGIQTRTIEGHVTDQTGEGIPDVRVRVKGETKIARTDANGNYTLKVSGGKVMLIFTADLYETKEVYAGKNAVVNVQLKERLQ